jgi:hypothetical protein
MITTQNKYIKLNRNKLNENADIDIQYNKEAKRIYHKILKNLSKIKFIPTENDFVKDTKGNIHILYGIKFNLQQLGEKYDLDILLVHEMGRTVSKIIKQTYTF